jgi:hypothetical protein
MADKSSKVKLLQILNRLGQYPQVDTPRRNQSMDPMPTYTDRSTFDQDGSNSDWQGKTRIAPGTRDRMPGTSPDMPKSKLEYLLRQLRIIPTPRAKDKRPEVGHPGDKYVKYI